MLDKIDIQKSELEVAAVPQHLMSRLKNLNLFRAKVRQIEPLPLLVKQKTALMNSIIMNSTSDELVVDDALKNMAVHNCWSIDFGISAIREMLANIIPTDNETSIIIKLPQPKDFQEAIEYQQEFFKAISQNITNDVIGGKVILKEWEPGSFWLTLSLGSILAVRLIGQMTWSAAVVRKKNAEALIFEQQADALKIKNETLIEIKNGIAKSIELVIEAEARALDAENIGLPDNHEQIERLKMGVKTFAMLIDKGAEIHPALQAPEDVKNLFPDFAKLPLIESKTKLLQAAAETH